MVAWRGLDWPLPHPPTPPSPLPREDWKHYLPPHAQPNTPMHAWQEDEVVGSLYFNMQVRDRQARILNFFLKYLTVPSERRKLKVRDPERFNWHPRRLLAQLAGLHVSLYRRDADAWVAANVADTDSLGTAPELFELLDGLLGRLGALPAADAAALRELSARVRDERAAAAAEEQALDDVPAEYEDPLLGTLMRDPVRLPSGNVLDRATIMQHLLTDQRDPFSRAPMREEDVAPLPELAAEIAAWLADQRRKRAETAVKQATAQGAAEADELVAEEAGAEQAGAEEAGAEPAGAKPAGAEHAGGEQGSLEQGSPEQGAAPMQEG